ncbi:MAG: hypothetical protein ACRD01_09965 [Terriglobales bacterium]
MTVRTTLSLDKDVYETALHLSHASGRRLGRVVSELARRGLTAAAPPLRRSRHSRFPVVPVPPGTPMIPASRVEAFLDEETD